MNQYEQVKMSFYFKQFTRTAGSFETALWNLFGLADSDNQILLGKAFPTHLYVYNEWMTWPAGERDYFKAYIRPESSI